jgi:dTDP-4-amino-4,6-dideoxygalactose transaminase
MIRVRFNDVSAGIAEQRDEMEAAIRSVLDRGDFIGGKAIGRFEHAFAEYTGSAHAVGVSNGTSALHLALEACGVRPGDEVITTPMTFIATAEAISHCGATPVFADINPGTLNLDAAATDQAITHRTKAIIFVHLHGNPSGSVEITELCQRRGLNLIEDCAQAHGARIPAPTGAGGSSTAATIHAGNLGIAACYSFFPAKNLGALGDAGAVTCAAPDLAARVRMLANHGREEKYRHLIEGYNYRIDTLQAAVLEVRLRYLETQVVRRNAIAARYEQALAELAIQLQSINADCRHARHLFVVQLARRDQLQQHLAKAGIETGIHYPIPLHLQPAYGYLNQATGAFPVAERVAAESLSLPLYPQLPDEHVDYVIDQVRKFFS